MEEKFETFINAVFLENLVIINLHAPTLSDNRLFYNNQQLLRVNYPQNRISPILFRIFALQISGTAVNTLTDQLCRVAFQRRLFPNSLKCT